MSHFSKRSPLPLSRHWALYTAEPTSVATKIATSATPGISNGYEWKQKLKNKIVSLFWIAERTCPSLNVCPQCFDVSIIRDSRLEVFQFFPFFLLDFNGYLATPVK